LLKEGRYEHDDTVSILFFTKYEANKNLRVVDSFQHVIQQGQYLAIEFLFENIHPRVLKDNIELLNFCLKENVGYCYP
jgi:hypothetical protein